MALSGHRIPHKRICLLLPHIPGPVAAKPEDLLSLVASLRHSSKTFPHSILVARSNSLKSPSMLPYSSVFI